MLVLRRDAQLYGLALLITFFQCNIPPVPRAIPVAEGDRYGFVLEAGLRHHPLQPKFLSKLEVSLLSLPVWQE